MMNTTPIPFGMADAKMICIKGFKTYKNQQNIYIFIGLLGVLRRDFHSETLYIVI
jgi:hypothetical protein